MIGLKSIAIYIPQDFVDNIKQGRYFNETEEYIRKRIGAVKLPRKAVQEETSDMSVSAIRNLLAKTHLSVEDIDALVVVTQNGDGSGLPHTSAIVQDKSGLPRTMAAFDISLGCSGYVYGLTILKGFLEASGLKNGILVTADPYSKVIDSGDKATSLLFGDAASATWIGEDAAWNIMPPVYHTNGKGAPNLCVRDGILKMNGRQIFNFAVLNMPAQIRQILDRENMAEEDIDAYILHQGSAAMLDVLSKKFPRVCDRFIIHMDETGNTVCSSIPILLERMIDSPGARSILVGGFGVGLSTATTIISRERS